MDLYKPLAWDLIHFKLKSLENSVFSQINMIFENNFFLNIEIRTELTSKCFHKRISKNKLRLDDRDDYYLKFIFKSN